MQDRIRGSTRTIQVATRELDSDNNWRPHSALRCAARAWRSRFLWHHCSVYAAGPHTHPLSSHTKNPSLTHSPVTHTCTTHLLSPTQSFPVALQCMEISSSIMAQLLLETGLRKLYTCTDCHRADSEVFLNKEEMEGWKEEKRVKI